MKWTWGDIVSVIAMVILTCVICYQNSLIREQAAQIEVNTMAIEKLTNNQNDIVEIDKEQTAAIVVLSDKINGRK